MKDTGFYVYIMVFISIFASQPIYNINTSLLKLKLNTLKYFMLKNNVYCIAY